MVSAQSEGTMKDDLPLSGIEENRLIFRNWMIRKRVFESRRWFTFNNGAIGTPNNGPQFSQEITFECFRKSGRRIDEYRRPGETK
jgi:hypothetical protein